MALNSTKILYSGTVLTSPPFTSGSTAYKQTSTATQDIKVDKNILTFLHFTMINERIPQLKENTCLRLRDSFAFVPKHGKAQNQVASGVDIVALHR